MKGFSVSILILALFFVMVNCLKINVHFQSTVTYDSLKERFGSSIDYKYYDNLNPASTNLYYGTITKQAYEMSIKLYKIDDYEQCSPSTPYATKDMQSCMVCPADKPLFNLGTRECQVCQPNITPKCDALFNISAPSLPTTTNSTSSTSTIANKTTNNTTKINQTIVNITKPENATVSSSVNNVTTSNGTKTNVTNTTAITSPVDSPYVVVWQPNRVGAVTNKTNQTSVTPLVPSIDTIPQDQVPSPSGQNLHQNYTINYLVVQNKTNATKTNATEKPLIAESQGQNKTIYSQQCPLDTPFFNQNTRLCQACKPSEQYISIQKKCLPIIYVSNPNNLYVILRQPDQILKANLQISRANPDRTTRLCPTSSPIVVNNSCSICSQQLIFNFTKQACQEGCPEGEIFSPANSKCVAATYLTNSDAPNLLSPITDFEVFRNGQKQKTKSSSIIIECPIVKPILLNGKCSNCPVQRPLYNIESKQCQDCSKNRYYEGLSRRCVSSFESGLQVKKMIPNIF